MERNTFIAAVFLVATGIMVPTCAQESKHDKELKQKYPFLSRLNIPSDDLPQGCSKPDLRPDDFPIKGLRQCAITSDSRAISALDRETKVGANNIEAIYYAVYKEAGELGVIGWTFTSEQVAKDAYKNATERDRYFKIWLQGKHVVALWQDTGTSVRCMTQMAANIERIVRSRDTNDE